KKFTLFQPYDLELYNRQSYFAKCVAANKTLIKFLNKDLNHRGFQYRIGTNREYKGWLHFTILPYYADYEHYGVFTADVEIPSEATVCVNSCGKQARTNSLVITKIYYLYDHQDFSSIATTYDDARIYYLT